MWLEKFIEHNTQLTQSWKLSRVKFSSRSTHRERPTTLISLDPLMRMGRRKKEELRNQPTSSTSSLHIVHTYDPLNYPISQSYNTANIETSALSQLRSIDKKLQLSFKLCSVCLLLSLMSLFDHFLQCARSRVKTQKLHFIVGFGFDGLRALVCELLLISFIIVACIKANERASSRSRSFCRVCDREIEQELVKSYALWLRRIVEWQAWLRGLCGKTLEFPPLCVHSLNLFFFNFPSRQHFGVRGAISCCSLSQLLTLYHATLLLRRFFSRFLFWLAIWIVLLLLLFHGRNGNKLCERLSRLHENVMMMNYMVFFAYLANNFHVSIFTFLHFVTLLRTLSSCLSRLHTFDELTQQRFFSVQFKVKIADAFQAVAQFHSHLSTHTMLLWRVRLFTLKNVLRPCEYNHRIIIRVNLKFSVWCLSRSNHYWSKQCSAKYWRRAFFLPSKRVADSVVLRAD